MKKTLIYQILTIFTTLLTIAVNGLANALPLNGQGTGEISDRFAIYFVPAGYVFSIWGIIYLGLIAFTIYQALPAQREKPLIQKILPAYWIANLANTVWIFLWHYEFFPLTLVAMLSLFAALLFIYLQLSKEVPSMTVWEKWLVKVPFSIYLGWVSVATIANATQVLYYFDWSGWGISTQIWAVIMLAVAALLGLAMYLREKDTAFVLVLVWALVGIALKQASSQMVSITAWAATGILAVTLFIGFVFNRRPVRERRI